MIKNMYQHNRIPFLLFIISVLTISQTYSIDIAKDKLKVFSEKEEYVPFISSYPLDIKNEKIKYAIISIHSSNYSANLAFCNIKALVNKYNLSDSTLIISPQFLSSEHIKDINSAGLIYWCTSPFWGTSTAKVTPNEKDRRISAYDITENIITKLSAKKEFPNIQSIIIIGHSAGGQFVNRFAASNTIEDTHAIPAGIKMKYIVMNPSSYVYFNPKRSVAGSVNKFAKPINIKTSYNNYGYGLDKLYYYHKQKGLTADKIRQQYKNRNVIYMLGEKDTQKEALSVSPVAMLEGANRLKRGLIYYGHLIDEFGSQIKENQKLVVIPNIGHSGKDMILSSRGTLNIIGDIVTNYNTHVQSKDSDLILSQEPQETEED